MPLPTKLKKKKKNIILCISLTVQIGRFLRPCVRTVRPILTNSFELRVLFNISNLHTKFQVSSSNCSRDTYTVHRPTGTQTNGPNQLFWCPGALILPEMKKKVQTSADYSTFFIYKIL
ncbi:hypothetical protein WDU94_008386 [Cyamophila willieti]